LITKGYNHLSGAISVRITLVGRIKLGNEKKPLILENESIDRPLINNYIPKKELKFSDIKAHDSDLYLFNLSGNPFISKSALRIGLFLYTYFNDPETKTKQIDWEMGEALYVSDKVDTTDNHSQTESFECIYRGNLYSYPRPLIDLIGLLADLGIEIKASNLLKALAELHDFHYITLSPRPVRKVGSTKRYSRSCFRHIRLYRGMMYKPFYPYLNNKEVFTRDRNTKVNSDS
jgi:hypothetical protein